MYSLIILLPLLSTCLIGLGGRQLGELGSNVIAVGHLVLTWILSLFLFWEVSINQSPTLIEFGLWVPFLSSPVYWGFLYDPLTSCMILVVSTISTLVHLYSVDYMKGDPHRPRFMAYLSFFTFFMLILVSSSNLLQMFVGWEGVGLCSYLLIGFWYTRIEANKSAIKAMVVNRIGDVGLLLVIFALWNWYGSIDYLVLKSLWANSQIPLIADLLILGLLIGATGKSAQLGLHTWLPDAMEGPTPVSALIHAATMVTAGVFLLIRMSALLEIGFWGIVLVAWIGALTALFAGTVGIFQQDLKKVIAYSTCSQLGYMVAACGLSLYSSSLFHLTTHAFFKALLFLGAGAIIHALRDEQDFRVMGNLIQPIPISYLAITIGSLALVGFPFLAGYFSKDLILELSYGVYWKQGVYGLLIIAAVCTAFYSLRLLFHTFLSPPKGGGHNWRRAHEGSWPLYLPLIILIFGSLTIGYLFQFILLGPVILTPISTSIKLVPIYGLISVVIVFLIWKSRKDNLFNKKVGVSLFQFFNQAWLFNTVFNTWFSKPLLKSSYTLGYKLVDRGILEVFGPTGLIQFLQHKMSYMPRFQSGLLYHYTFIMLLGACFLYAFSS